jgi:N-acetylmuramic acid 6-phosphate etherase
VVALLAGEHEVPGSAAEAAAEDDVDAGAADVTRAGAGSLDLCIGVSASGRTPYTLGAVRAAKAAGALTGAVVCQRGSALGEIAEVTVEVPVGPEVIAGSTRLKAATAQKLALGAFSTAVMVKRGRVLGNLMACMRVSNEKLRQRAVAVCCAATDCDERTGSLALEQSGGVLESALVMLLAGVDAAAAADALAATGGHLPAAVKRAGAPPAGTL